MPTTSGNITDFKVYQDKYYMGLIESIDQNVSVLNEGAGGAIRVLTANTRGEFETRSFFQNIDDLVADRDPTDLSQVPVQKVTQGEVTDVLKNYRIGPVRQTLDSFRKISLDPQYMSFILGSQMGEKVTQKILNAGLAAVIAAIESEANSMVFDNTDPANAARTGGTTISARAMNRAAGLMGDRRSSLRALVTNSAVATELWDNQLSEKLGEVSGALVYGAEAGTLGLPVWITDSPALSAEVVIEEGQGEEPDVTATVHYVLMLTEEALVIQQQDYMDVYSDMVGGAANLQAFYQAESGYLARVKGFSWGGSNSPTDGEFADDANWTYVYNSHKDGPGILLVVNDVEPAAE